MKRAIILLLFLLPVRTTQAQQVLALTRADSCVIYLNDSNQRSLQFNGGWGGNINSKNLYCFSWLIEDEQYERVRGLLFSEVPATQFLAVLACKNYSEKHYIILTEKEKHRISELEQSEAKVFIRWACTGHGLYSLSELLTGRSGKTHRHSARAWL